MDTQKPQLIAFLLANYIRWEGTNLTIINPSPGTHAKEFPHRIAINGETNSGLFLYRSACGCKGSVEQIVELIDPDGESVFEAKSKLVFMDTWVPTMQAMPLERLPFDKFGTHYFQWTVAGHLIGNTPFSVAPLPE